MISQKLYECVWCKHLYQEPPSSCDCMGNEENLYETWTAHRDGRSLFEEIKEGFEGEGMKFEDGKYEVVFDERGIPQQVLRYGEPWRDLIGDKFMYLVLSELKSLQGTIKDSAILPAKEWSDLEYWLDHCYDKGHLENCSDLIEPLEALNKARGFE